MTIHKIRNCISQSNISVCEEDYGYSLHIFLPGQEYPETSYKIVKQPCHITEIDIELAVTQLQAYLEKDKEK